MSWAGQGLAQLIEVLSGLPPAAPAWNWGRQPPVAGFWHRRMAHEVLIHRRDTERAVGAPLTGYGPLAGDGLAELLTLFLPRRRHREPWSGPTGTISVRPTDGAGWLVRVGAGQQLAIEPGDSGGDVVLRGTAEELLLAGWGRHPLAAVLVSGDPALAAGLLAE